jgi:hypothetical protein
VACDSKNKDNILKIDKQQNPAIQNMFNHLIESSLNNLEKNLDEKTSQVRSTLFDTLMKDLIFEILKKFKQII